MPNLSLLGNTGQGRQRGRPVRGNKVQTLQLSKRQQAELELGKRIASQNYADGRFTKPSKFSSKLQELEYNIVIIQGDINELSQELISNLSNLSNAINDYFIKKNFVQQFEDYVHKKLKNVLKRHRFKTAGLLETYINSIKFELNITDSFNIEFSWNDDKFDRDRMILTSYTTADGKSVTHSILSGEIIDMVDKGRNDFEIHATNGKVVVGKNGERYRYVVYRAKRKVGDTNVYKYRKSYNYKNYDPSDERQKIKLITEDAAIKVNGKRKSKFGLGLYKRITEYLYDESLIKKILGDSFDNVIYNILYDTCIHGCFDIMLNKANELKKYTKMYVEERNKLK